MRLIVPVLAATLLAMSPLPAHAVDDTELERICTLVLAKKGAASCPCFVGIARQEMSPLQREALYVHLSGGQEVTLVKAMGDDQRLRYEAAMEKLTARVQAECRP